MKPFMYDHLQSVEYLSDGRVRVVAVLPFATFDEILSSVEKIVHVSRWLNTRSRCARAMSAKRKVYITNLELANVR
jgi:hypothetical protein